MELTGYNGHSQIKKGPKSISMNTSTVPTCQNAQLTDCDCQRRMRSENGIISMNTGSNMPDCPTHQLWLPGNHQHDKSHQHARMHNSPSMIARAGSRMDMGSSASSKPPICLNAQLTSYDCQSTIKNRHCITNMIRATNMPECSTHQLVLPKQDQEWTWYHQHD